MKMDIEGHELFALRGAQRSLAAGKIGALAFEFGCGDINSRTFFRDYWELLTAANFAIYRIPPMARPFPSSNISRMRNIFRVPPISWPS
jgi:hypothetical protein